MSLGPKPIQKQIAKDIGQLDFDTQSTSLAQRLVWLSGMTTAAIALLAAAVVVRFDTGSEPVVVAVKPEQPSIETTSEPEKAPIQVADAAVCASELNALARFSTIYFEADSVLLDRDGLSKARQVADALQVCPNMTLQVWGHADGSGSDEANMKISQKRADNTMVALEKMGFDTSRMQAMAAGASLPLAQGDTDETLDRRVEFRVLPNQ